jgi:hypothetical protein
LGQTSDGNLSIVSDSWLATGVFTGNNVGGYLLNSIQLAMTDAYGNPSDFSVMIYNESDNLHAVLPGSSLGSLNGSLSPVTGSIYTYVPASSLTLSPNTFYFIVLTAGTTVAKGAYESSFTHTSIYNPGDDLVLSISLSS